MTLASRIGGVLHSDVEGATVFCQLYIHSTWGNHMLIIFEAMLLLFSMTITNRNEEKAPQKYF